MSVYESTNIIQLMVKEIDDIMADDEQKAALKDDEIEMINSLMEGNKSSLVTWTNYVMVTALKVIQSEVNEL